MASEVLREDRHWVRAVWVLAARMVAAVVITSVIYGWGYNYLYEASAFPNLATTAAGRFQQFVTTATGLMALGLIPAACAVLTVVTVPHRRILPTVLAAVIPNVVCGAGWWVMLWIGWSTLLAALLLVALGSVTFFLALLPWHLAAARGQRRSEKTGDPGGAPDRGH